MKVLAVVHNGRKKLFEVRTSGRRLAFPYSKAVESDAMGGGVWKDNGDGTFTQIDDDYYSPANGYSWLNLYLMGLAKPADMTGRSLLEV